MEEKKIASKEVKMKPLKTGEEQPQKLSYEELNQACAEMSQQLQNQNAYIQRMRQQMQQMEFMLQTKRMDYLFKVVELQLKKEVFTDDFYFGCAREIEESLTIPEKSGEEKGKEG